MGLRRRPISGSDAVHGRHGYAISGVHGSATCGDHGSATCGDHGSAICDAGGGSASGDDRDDEPNRSSALRLQKNRQRDLRRLQRPQLYHQSEPNAGLG